MLIRSEWLLIPRIVSDDVKRNDIFIIAALYLINTVFVRPNA